MTGVPLVDAFRGGRLESTHAVAACACDDTGARSLTLGEVEVPVFLRSAAKPFIAAAVVRAGAAERFGLGPRELAVMSASHRAEPEHLAAVGALLARIGASVDDLRCGGAPTALHNNCSGKHAGILALAQLRGAPLAGYLAPDHPAQREILAFCERVFDDRFGPDRIAVDGCGIPAFATALATAARGFARLATLRGFDDADRAALRAVREAMLAHPWMVAGTDRFDTDLMTAAAGSLIAKGGAEGVHASALVRAGTGLVVKVVDGASRATAPAVLALLQRLGVGTDDERLAAHARTPIRNVAGRIVGEVRARS